MERQFVFLCQRLENLDHFLLEFGDGRVGVDTVIDDGLGQFGKSVYFDSPL
jgi:hypothetical protein